mmetsp:Transcript_3140/g.7578  ORF Transcript_3140/g.7578 Transcript_3140/m.7578 type:complete len:246 (+) Transcript_3140:756-1493(+)
MRRRKALRSGVLRRRTSLGREGRRPALSSRRMLPRAGMVLRLAGRDLRWLLVTLSSVRHLRRATSRGSAVMRLRLSRSRVRLVRWKSLMGRSSRRLPHSCSSLSSSSCPSTGGSEASLLLLRLRVPISAYPPTHSGSTRMKLESRHMVLSRDSPRRGAGRSTNWLSASDTAVRPRRPLTGKAGDSIHSQMRLLSKLTRSSRTRHPTAAGTAVRRLPETDSAVTPVKTLMPTSTTLSPLPSTGPVR